MRVNFTVSHLAFVIAGLTATTFANAAGMDRSGQDTTAFFQDGTYAEASYTYIDADVTGRDSAGNKIKDIAEDYDFFRYGVKTDINDRFSIGVLYDEPWGADADYHGPSNFTGVANRTGMGAIQGIANNAIANTQQKIAEVQRLQAAADPVAQPLASTVYDSALSGLNATLENFQQLAQQPSIEGFNNVLLESRANLEASQATLSTVAPLLDATTAQQAQALVARNTQDAQILAAANAAVKNLYNINEQTNVEVRTYSLTGLAGMKFGDSNQYQVYGGPVAQRLQAEVHLRGDAYTAASGYDLSVNPDIDYGWIAGLQYSKPEIALKASLTYRSEIDHDVEASEIMPLLALRRVNPIQTNDMTVTTPESVNFDFQTGVNTTTLATAKVRWVPWGDFKITPPTYHEASKFSIAEGLNLVDYDDDQWVVELGLAKRVAPELAVSGTVGWDSGAGDPTTSLGPIDGYYSVGAGAKYNVTDEWAISAGGKYLWFGDAKGEIPTGAVVSDFGDNDGFVLGVKLSYQADSL